MTTLAKGGNTALPTAVCRVTLTSSPTTGIDVSAVLLAHEGKVRSDDDLVFYNHPAQDGIRPNGQTVVADLAAVPTAVDRIAVVASIDPEGRVAHFDPGNTPQAVVECGDLRITFVPQPFVHQETVAVLIELYRRAGGWKARAVGQGWATGLAGLASDFGIVVDDPGPSAAPAPPAPTPLPPGPPPPTPRTPSAPLGKVALTKAGQATIGIRKDDPRRPDRLHRPRRRPHPARGEVQRQPRRGPPDAVLQRKLPNEHGQGRVQNRLAAGPGTGTRQGQVMEASSDLALSRSERATGIEPA